MEKKIRFCPATIFILILAFFNFIGIISTFIIGGRAFPSILELLVQIYFCIILFMKKRGIPAFIALGAFALLQIIGGSYLGFLAYALLFVLALSACEKRIIKTDFFKKINFVPGLLIILDIIVGIIIVISVVGFQAVRFSLLGYALNILEMIIVFIVGKWLAYPYAKGAVETATVVEAPAAEEAASESAET